VERSLFGELLRRYRVAADLTQEELAEGAGVSVRAISDLERGLKQSPRATTLRLLIGALRLSDAQAERLRQAATSRRLEPN